MDPILYWNEVALEANRVSHTDFKDKGTLGPTLSSRALAIVHLAMYDAYAGVQNSAGATALLPYQDPATLPTPAPGASPDGAVAAAAHATLSALFPSQKAFFAQKHQEMGLTGPGQEVEDGHLYGLAIAQKLLDDRKNDPSASDDGYAPSPARAAHRADPDNPSQGYHAPFYGARSKCFAVSERYTLAAPPRPGDANYLRALRQVRGKGIAPELMGTLPPDFCRRTPDETVIGIYWGYDGATGLGTPPRLYNQIIRKVATNPDNPLNQYDTVARNAKLFALVNAAMGDAGILAWEQKYIHDLWRPVVGIREHDKSIGPIGQASNNLSNDGDASWLPLGAPKTNGTDKNFTPPFPAYPSGHATFGAAAFQMTRLVYGVPANQTTDTLFDGLEFVSDEYNGVNKDNRGAVRPRHARNFPDGLWQMIIENGLSRVYLGVHWVFDAFTVNGRDEPDLYQNVGGVRLGLTIAEDIYERYTNVIGLGMGTGYWKSTVGPRG